MTAPILELNAKLGLNSSEFNTGIKNAKEDAGSFASSFSGVIKKVVTGVAAFKAASAAVKAFTGFMKQSVQAGMGFDSSMSKVAATMGMNMAEIHDPASQAAKDFEQLRDFAKEMGRTTMFTAQQSADALQYMALAGYDVKESMNMLPTVLDLAAAGSMDLARASDMVTDAQTAFGMTADRTKLMVDEMAKTASTTNTSVEQLGDAFLTVGALAQELNGGFVTMADGSTVAVDGIQELEIALGAMANSGIKGSEAGTHMRNMIMKLTSPTKEGTEALEALGVSVFDAGGQMRSLSDIFGDLSGAMGNLTQAQKLNVISDLFNARDLASAEALLRAVSSDWDAIGAGIVNAEGAASKMSEMQMDNLTGAMMYFQSAMEGAKIALSDRLTPALTDFAKFGTSAISDLTAAFEDGGLEGLVDKLDDVFSEGLDLIIGKIPDFMSGMGQVMSAIGSGILKSAPVFASAAKQVLGMLFNYVITGLPEAVKSGAAILHSMAEGVKENIPVMLEQVLPMILQFTETLRENFGVLVDSGIEIITGLVDGLIEGLPTLIEYVPEIVTNIAGLINDNAPKLLETGFTLLGNIIHGIIDNIPVLLANIGDIVVAIVSVFTAFNWLQLGSTLITLLGNGIKALATSIPSALKTIATNGFNAVKMIDWKGVGIAIINGIIAGIQAFGATLKTALLNIVEGAWKGVKNFFGIASPSKLMRDTIGKFIPLGLAEGIKSTSDKVYEAMSSMSKGTEEAYDPEFDDDPFGDSPFKPSGSGSSAGGVIAAIEGLTNAVLNRPVVLDSGELVSATVPKINRKLGSMVSKERRT